MKNWTFFQDLKVAQEGLLSFGFWALQIYRFGHLRYKFKSKLIRFPLAIIHIILAKLGEMLFGVTIGVAAQIGKRFTIEHSGAIVIHGNAQIGDDCIVRQGVTIGNRRLDQPFDAPIIGNNVNIGAGAKILGKVTIGDNAVIGANAVVVKDVPANRVAVGIPAKLLPEKTESTSDEQPS